MVSKTNKIGFWTAVALVVGNVVGSGAFALPATLALYGDLALLGWMISAIGAISLALVFGGLSSRVTQSGGPYAFAAKAFGKDVGFYVCYGYWVMSWISNAALAVICVGLFSNIFGEFSNLTKFILEAVIILGVMKFNLFNIQVTAIGEIVITTIKVGSFMLLPLAGLAIIDYSNLSFSLAAQGDQLYTNLNAIIFQTIWAFIGIEAVTVPAGQIKDAKNTIPRALIVGTLVATLIYVLGSFVTLKTIPMAQLIASTAPYADLAATIFGGSWGLPISILGIIVVLGSLNGWTMIVARIPQSASKDGIFPEIFSRTDKNGTPIFGVIISSILALAFTTLTLRDSLMQQFDLIASASVTVILVIYIVSILAYVKILYRNKELDIKSQFLATIGLAFCIYACCAIKMEWAYISLGLVATGIPVHLLNRKKN